MSVELSPASNYTGGLYLGPRMRYSQEEARWLKAAPQPWPRGSAIVHRGNLTHGVSVRSGTRWSLIVFFFSDCATQQAGSRRLHAASGRGSSTTAVRWWDEIGRWKSAFTVLVASTLLMMIWLTSRQSRWRGTRVS